MLTDYRLALDWVYSQKPANLKFPGKLGHKRAKALLKLLGNPQERFKSIHIAGTSGKGSTAYILSCLLRVHGFKTGLNVSPHLLNLRERIQINNNLISESDFTSLFNKLQNAARKLPNHLGKVTYFELLIAAAFLYYAREQVDYAVIETGMGGLYDTTNTIKRQNKLSVLTRIGYDHMAQLGKTLKSITFNKAAIINRKSTAITLKQGNAVLEVIRNTVKARQAKLQLLDLNGNLRRTGPNSYDFFLPGLQLQNVTLGMQGDFQAENTLLALAALNTLAKRDKWTLDPEKIRKTLKALNFPGRFDSLTWRKKRLIIDGAHNPQKMEGFLQSLQALFPKKKFVFLIGFKRAKDFGQMLESLVKRASHIVLAPVHFRFPDLQRISVPLNELAAELERLGFRNYSLLPETSDSLRYYLENAELEELVITGSLYLAAEVYEIIAKP